MSRFDDTKRILAEARNHAEYSQARTKEILERGEKIVFLINEVLGILCLKDVEDDFDKLLARYRDIQEREASHD